jgi:hypothetical protein
MFNLAFADPHVRYACIEIRFLWVAFYVFRATKTTRMFRIRTYAVSQFFVLICAVTFAIEALHRAVSHRHVTGLKGMGQEYNVLNVQIDIKQNEWLSGACFGRTLHFYATSFFFVCRVAFSERPCYAHERIKPMSAGSKPAVFLKTNKHVVVFLTIIPHFLVPALFVLERFCVVSE